MVWSLDWSLGRCAQTLQIRPAGSETSEEVKARAALVARARKSRKALARRVRKVLASKAEALNQRSESVPDPVQAAVEQQTPDEDQETQQEADTSGQPASVDTEMPQAEEIPAQPERRSQEEILAETDAQIASLNEHLGKVSAEAAAAKAQLRKVKPSYSQIVADSPQSQPSGSQPRQFAAQPATAAALGSLLSQLTDFDISSVDPKEQDALFSLFSDQQGKKQQTSKKSPSKQQARRASKQRRRAKLQKKLQALGGSDPDSSGSSSEDSSSDEDSDWEVLNSSRGKKSRTLGHGSKPDADSDSDAEAKLKQKRSLAKLAMQVVDHLPCKFVDWKKGPAKWLLTVESAAYAVELPFEYLINRLGKAIGAESAKMAEWISDHTLEGGALSCTWQDYKTAFVQYFPALPTCVNRDTWAALSMDSCGGFHKYVQTFQQQAAEVCPSEAEKIHTFKRGLSSALQNAVLLDTTTKEPWTEFAPLLKVATSFANAMLAPNRRTQGSVTADTAGRSSGDHKLARKEKRKTSSTSSGPSHGNTSANDADLAEQKAKFTAKAQTSWCRKTLRCDVCHQIGHQKAACPNKDKQAAMRQEALDDFHRWRKENNIHFRPRKNGKGKQKAPFRR